jgi:uncharacterized protein YukE
MDAQAYRFAQDDNTAISALGDRKSKIENLKSGIGRRASHRFEMSDFRFPIFD